MDLLFSTIFYDICKRCRNNLYNNSKIYTVNFAYNDVRYNDIPFLTTLFSLSGIFVLGFLALFFLVPNDTRYNDNFTPVITTSFSRLLLNLKAFYWNFANNFKYLWFFKEKNLYRKPIITRLLQVVVFQRKYSVY